MTKQFTITPEQGHEPPNETPMSLAFRDVLKTMHAFIVAERDLEDIAYSRDPAYAIWAEDTEKAHEDLVDALVNVHSLPVETREDQPLRRMALLADAMIGHEEPGGARALHLQMQVAFFTKFQACGISSTAMHRNGLLIHGRHLIDAMIGLPLFDGGPVDGPHIDEPPENDLGAAF